MAWPWRRAVSDGRLHAAIMEPGPGFEPGSCGSGPHVLPLDEPGAVPPEGVEPTTSRLKAGCSTVELRGRIERRPSVFVRAWSSSAPSLAAMKKPPRSPWVAPYSSYASGIAHESGASLPGTRTWTLVAGAQASVAGPLTKRCSGWSRRAAALAVTSFLAYI